MQTNGTLTENISSARQFADYETKRLIAERMEHEEKERRRKADEATQMLLMETERQNQILKVQLDEVRKSNELLVKQANDSNKSAHRSSVTSIISLVVAIISAISAIVSLALQLKG